MSTKVSSLVNISEFSKRFKKLRGKGFVPSLRSGPTGVGYTIETLTGIDENNLSYPDIKDAELKAHRTGSNNLITLFTFIEHN